MLINSDLSIGVIKCINSKESLLLVVLIKRIGETNRKKYLSLLKDNSDTFYSLKKASKSSELVEQIDSVIDLIEGRNIDQLESKLNENENKISDLKSVVLIKGKNIDSLNTKVKSHELKITNLNQNVNEVNEKLAEIDDTLDAHETKIGELDEKTLLNVPTWCKDLSKILAKENQWMLVAKRFNFTETDIKGWLNQNDPCLSMFQEVFVQYKASDAINSLLKIFTELNNIECREIVERNLSKVEEDNKLDLNEQEVERELIANPPQIFISYEWSTKAKAELLRKYLYMKLNEPLPSNTTSTGSGNSKNVNAFAFALLMLIQTH